VKIVICSKGFIPEVGGVQKNVMLLAQGLAESTPARGATGYRPGVDRRDGLQVTVVSRRPAKDFDDSVWPFRVVRRPNLRTLWRLLGDADVVHLATPIFLPLLLSLVRRKPVVVRHHMYEAACPNGFLRYEPTNSACPGHFMARRYHECLRCNAATIGWRRSLQMLLLTFPRRWLCHLVAVNTPVTHHVAARVKLPRTQTIYHGIPDPLPGRPDGDVTDVAALRRPLCFAYVGRFVAEKGLPLLLEAAARLKQDGLDFRLKFVGDGSLRGRLEAMTGALGLRDRVIFTGFLRGQALQDALEDVAAVLMPSTWEETFGMAALEQMMRGRLVIAADIGGLGEVVGSAGLKFPAGDVDGLARCMQRVLETPELVTSVGREARARSLQLFQQDRMAGEHLAIYQRLVRSPNHRRTARPAANEAPQEI
jgi:glycosyltransferase involved in cell wall biosynthesis